MTLELYKLVCSLLHTVQVEVIADRTMLDDHLTICIELILASSQTVLCSKGFSQVNGSILCQLVVLIDEVVVTLEFYKLVGFLLHAIHIEEIANRTLLDDHLTICIELIFANSQGGAVRKGFTADKSLRQVNLAVLCDLTTIAHEIEVSFLILNQLICSDLLAIYIEVIFMAASKQRCNAVSAAVIVRKCTCGKSATSTGTIIKSGDASLHVAISVEKVCLTINFIRTAGCLFRRHIPVIAGTVPITYALTGSCPRTSSQAAVLKRKEDRVICILLAISASKGGFVEVVPHIVNSDPAGGQNAIDSIVVHAVDGLQTCDSGDDAAMAG